MSSERAREREVHRYYQCWLESLVIKSDADKLYMSDSYRNNGSEIKSSRDKALIAFAQLGCIRLNAKRGIVTLISSSRSFILAESTKSTSLISDQAFARHDELWFGEASLPRSQGLSENALHPPVYTTQDEFGNRYSAPALVLSDITVDSRFSKFKFAGKGVTFYAGVPITSRTGFAIGVFTVTDDRPRNGLTAEELRFMQDMATVVRDHFDIIRNNAARYRGERLTDGLASFIKGRQSIYETVATLPAFIDSSGDKVLPKHTDLGDIRGEFKGMTVSSTNANTLQRTWSSRDNPEKMDRERAGEGIVSSLDNLDKSAAQSEETGPLLTLPGPSTNVNPTSDPGAQTLGDVNESAVPIEMRKIFDRAANILRESTGADGVVFHDATSCNKGMEVPAISSDVDSKDVSASEENLPSSGSIEDLKAASSGSSRRSSSGSDGGVPFPTLGMRAKRARCQVLGFSFKGSTVAKTQFTSIESLALSENNLSRLIRRYFRGKVFHYTQDGQVSSSENDDVQSYRAGVSKSTEKGASGRAIAEDLLRIVPGARNVVFLPLWDFSKDRWNAGCFVWSSRVENLLAAQDDLSYLKAFGNSIMSEVARVNISVADKAKSSFIANISHELRSPLHGILGSIEFLQQTPFDAFQSAMINTVEICGRTLLDTVDHVLDYAKINQLSKMSSRKKRLKRGTAIPRTSGFHGVEGTDTLTSNFDLAVVLEEIVEATYAGQVFRSAGAFHRSRDEKNRRSRPVDVFSHAASEAKDDSSTESENQGSSIKALGKVRLSLDMEMIQSWVVRAQPGAIRRIVMNLLGNALKYTQEGYVHVVLKAVEQRIDDLSRLSFIIVVKDSGRGMSQDFAQNHAFTAFRQEDSFSSGTGLGLSIVGQIVSSLGGRINLQSQKGIGTEVKVWLTLPIAPIDSHLSSLNSIERVASQTRARKLCLVAPDYLSTQGSSLQPKKESNIYLEDSILAFTRDWFSMDAFRSDTVGDNKADVFVFAEPPDLDYVAKHLRGAVAETDILVIIIASSAFDAVAIEAQVLLNKHELRASVEVISIPCGPQKLGRALSRSLEKREPISQPERCLTDGAAGNDDGVLVTSSLSEVLHEKTSDSTIRYVGKSLAREENLSSEEDQVPLTGYINHLEQTDNANTQKPPRPDISRKTSSSTTDTTESISMSAAKGPILLVDDNEVNLKLLVAFIRKGKFPYEQASDGLQAVEAYKRASTDPAKAFRYICMDVSMPHMDGLTATREIRYFEKENGIRPAHIIALTGLASEATQQEAFKSGVDDYFPKPVRFRELLKLLNR